MKFFTFQHYIILRRAQMTKLIIIFQFNHKHENFHLESTVAFLCVSVKTKNMDTILEIN